MNKIKTLIKPIQVRNLKSILMKENFHNNFPIWICAGKMMAVASKLEAHRKFRTVGRDYRRDSANPKAFDTEELADRTR